MSESSLVQLAVALIAALSPVLATVVKARAGARSKPRAGVAAESMRGHWWSMIGGAASEGVGVFAALGVLWASAQVVARESDAQLAQGHEQLAAVHGLATHLYVFAATSAVAWMFFDAGRVIAKAIEDLRVANVRIAEAQRASDEAAALLSRANASSVDAKK